MYIFVKTMKDMITTEKKIGEDTFNSLFKEVRFKKEKNEIHVFNGKSIRKKIRTKPNSIGLSLPNVIMTYSVFGGSLEIRYEVYKNFIKQSPEFESNKSFLYFFKDWFENKFKIELKRVYVADKLTMDKMK
jgi:hypothetical protein